VQQVRDRATLCLNLLEDGPDASVSDDAQKFLFEGLDVPLENLEASLQKYMSPFSYYYSYKISDYASLCKTLRYLLKYSTKKRFRGTLLWS
jgi:hypothetical protein